MGYTHCTEPSAGWLVVNSLFDCVKDFTMILAFVFQGEEHVRQTTDDPRR